MLSVEANSVNLINEGESSILVSDVTKLLEWADGTVHGVDSLEGNDLKNTKTSGNEKIHKLKNFWNGFQNVNQTRFQMVEDLTFGTLVSTLERSCSRWTGSLCLKTCLGTRLLRMPWIMDAWLPASEKMWHPKKRF